VNEKMMMMLKIHSSSNLKSKCWSTICRDQFLYIDILFFVVAYFSLPLLTSPSSSSHDDLVVKSNEKRFGQVLTLQKWNKIKYTTKTSTSLFKSLKKCTNKLWKCVTQFDVWGCLSAIYYSIHLLETTHHNNNKILPYSSFILQSHSLSLND
jgi:hypothetical protein